MVLTEGLKWRMLQCKMAGVEIRGQRSTELVGESLQDGSGLLIPTSGFYVAMRSQGGGQRGWGDTGGEEIPRRIGGQGGEDEVARGKDGGAPVSGLAGSSSKATGAWRRRSSGGARGWWGTSTALGDGGGADQELCPNFGGRRRKKGHI